MEGLVIRKAKRDDVEAIVRLSNAGGPGGSEREPLPAVLPSYYFTAFAKIDQDPQSALMVAELDGQLIGTFHITYITYLNGKGREDAQIESVHVSQAFRNRGIGALMMTWAIEQAKARGCRRMQLTSDKARRDAHRFYERLGFKASHEGMKLSIN